MDRICGYEVVMTVMFENGYGVALGYSPKADMPFVTWMCRTNKTNPRRRYDWPCYCPDRGMGEADLWRRVQGYQQHFSVKIRCVEASVPDNPDKGWDGPRSIMEQLAEAERLAQEYRAAHGGGRPDRGEEEVTL